MRLWLEVIVWLLVLSVTAAIATTDSPKTNNDEAIIDSSFENPNCLKWGEKKTQLCVKRGPKVCKSWGFYSSPYCAQFEPICESYRIRMIKKCTGKKKICTAFNFTRTMNCKSTKKACSSIKYVNVKRKIVKKGKCKKFAYHEYPVCAEKHQSCFPPMFKNQCKDKERKCVERAIRRKRTVCAEYGTVFQRGPKYCAKFAPKYKCTRYRSKKFCEKYRIEAKSRNKLLQGFIIVKNGASSKTKKKCVQWKRYFPLVKRRKCVRYLKKRICDVKMSTAKEIRIGPFFPTEFKSQCLKYRYLKTAQCLKYKLVNQRICTKKTKFAERCLLYKRPIIRQKICIAFKTGFSMYCKKYATFCKDDKNENCKGSRKVCNNWKMEKKPLYCVEYERKIEYKTVKKAVCQYSNECIDFRNHVSKICTQYGEKCVRFKFLAKRTCSKKRQQCVNIAYKKTGKFCEMYAKGPCKVNREIKKRVCLEWKKK